MARVFRGQKASEDIEVAHGDDSAAAFTAVGHVGDRQKLMPRRVDDDGGSPAIHPGQRREGLRGAGVGERDAVLVEEQEPLVNILAEKLPFVQPVLEPVVYRRQVEIEAVAHRHAQGLVDQIGLCFVAVRHLAHEDRLLRDEVGDGCLGPAEFAQQAGLGRAAQLLLRAVGVGPQDRNVDEEDRRAHDQPGRGLEPSFDHGNASPAIQRPPKNAGKKRRAAG